MLYDLSNTKCCEVERTAKASHKHELGFRTNLTKSKSFLKALSFFRRMSVGDKSLESLKHEEKVTVCPDCGCTELDFDKGETFCKKCGLVLD